MVMLSIEVESSTTKPAGQVNVGKWSLTGVGGLGAARVGPKAAATGYPATCQLATSGEVRFYHSSTSVDKFWGIVIALI